MNEIQLENNQTNPQPQKQNDLELYGRLRLGALVVGVFILTIIGKACHNKNGVDKTPGQEIKIEHPEKINVQTPQEPIKTISKYIPPEGGITITPKDKTKSIDDLIKIHYQEIGWTFEPGIEFSGNLYYSYGLDAKLFYAYRFGVGAGVVAGNNVVSVLSPDVFISYRLDQIHLRNTEAIATYVPLGKIPFGIGLRLNF